MKSPIQLPTTALLGATLLLTAATITPAAEGDQPYRGFPNKYEYVGPGPTKVTRTHPAAYAGRRGAVVSGPHGTALIRRPLPRGYIRSLPGPARRVMYRGSSAYYINGVYYRPVQYGGETVYTAIK